MKTITIKLQEEQAEELNEFVKSMHYPSKSEFIRQLIMEKIEKNLTKKTIEEIKQSINEIKQGKTISLRKVEKEYGL